jgi:hypothetical protein
LFVFFFIYLTHSNYLLLIFPLAHFASRWVITFAIEMNSNSVKLLAAQAAAA